MSASPGPADLTTVAAVAAWLGQDPAQDASLLQSLVTAASAFIQSWTGCAFATASYTETRDGNGREVMAFGNGPVAAVTSVTIDGVVIQPSAGWPQSGFTFDGAILYLTGYSFTSGRRNVQLTYSAGYAATPPDVMQACNELVGVRYRLRDKSGLVSEGAMQQTTAYAQTDMPASVKAALGPYRRVFLT